MEKKKRMPQIILEETGIPNTSEFSHISTMSGGWTITKFRKNFRIQVVKESDDGNILEFDLIGCSAAIANAFRRILLSEVPSMAIDKVFILNNTSIIQDEVLAQRLGLIPLKADPRLFEFPPSNSKEQLEVSDQDTLRYEMKVNCEWNKQAAKNTRLPSEMYNHSSVYSKDIKWVPIGHQRDIYPQGEQQLRVLEDEILICKLRPGQELHVFMHAIKGIGQDHAKFSPVATAWYRQMPEIKIKKPIRGEAAKRCQAYFSPGVIELVEHKKGYKEARVKDARHDSYSRNVYMYEELRDCIELTLIPDHFIYTVESIGTLPSSILFIEAVKILKKKCRTFLEELNYSKADS